MPEGHAKNLEKENEDEKNRALVFGMLSHAVCCFGIC